MESHNGFAWEYDREATRYQWHGPEVLFGLMYERVGRGEALLDLGIGTGLSALPFHRAGVAVSGIDGSKEMLEVCRSKDFATDLRHWDLSRVPLPYENDSFDHLIACGVFHFLEEIEPTFSEAARLLGGRGTFGFTFEQHSAGAPDATTIRAGDVSRWADEASGITMFRHGEGYVTACLKRSGLTVVKMLEFVASVHPDTGKKIIHKAIVATR